MKIVRKIWVLGLCLIAFGPAPLMGADWCVATNGQASAAGTKEAPWDITSALGAQHKLAPGDTVWIKGGLYKFPPQVGGKGFPVKLAGTDNAPIHVRALPGERVSID